MDKEFSVEKILQVEKIVPEIWFKNLVLEKIFQARKIINIKSQLSEKWYKTFGENFSSWKNTSNNKIWVPIVEKC